MFFHRPPVRRIIHHPGLPFDFENPDRQPPHRPVGMATLDPVGIVASPLVVGLNNLSLPDAMKRV